MNDMVIIIVNYNGKQLTLDCLETVFQFPPNCMYEIILVDNASTDGSVDAIRKAFPEVRIIENEVNAGFVRANNLAIKHSDSRFIVLLNNDTLVKPGCFDHLYQFIKVHPEVGIAGARMYYRDGTLQMSCFMFQTIKHALYETLGLTSLFSKSQCFSEYEMTWWDHKTMRQVDWISNDCSITWRSVLEQVGGYDENDFMLAPSDDIDMGYKMKEAGYKIIYLPSAELIHYSGGNLIKPYYRRVMEANASMRYTMRKYHVHGYYLIWNCIKTLGLILKLVKWILLSIFSPNREQSFLNVQHFYYALIAQLQPLKILQKWANSRPLPLQIRIKE